MKASRVFAGCCVLFGIAATPVHADSATDYPAAAPGSEALRAEYAAQLENSRQYQQESQRANKALREKMARDEEETHKMNLAIMARMADTLSRQEQDLAREERYLARHEQDMARYEKILATWERQQAQYQRYLDALAPAASRKSAKHE